MARLRRYEDVPVVGLGASLVRRDSESAGSMIGSAVAFRLFLFFVPLLLFLVGLAGFFGGHISAADVERNAGVSSGLGQQIQHAFHQSGRAPWFITALGLFGMATTGPGAEQGPVRGELPGVGPADTAAVVGAGRGRHRRVGRRHGPGRAPRQPGAGRSRCRGGQPLVRAGLRHLPRGVAAHHVARAARHRRPRRPDPGGGPGVGGPHRHAPRQRAVPPRPLRPRQRALRRDRRNGGDARLVLHPGPRGGGGPGAEPRHLRPLRERVDAGVLVAAAARASRGGRRASGASSTSTHRADQATSSSAFMRSSVVRMPLRLVRPRAQPRAFQ